VPVQSFVHARRFHRLLTAGAIGLVLWQSLIASFALAHATVPLSAVDPADFALCHGAGNIDTDPGAPPGSDDAWYACCVFCLAQPSLLGVDKATITVERSLRYANLIFGVRPDGLVFAPRAVRAGLSQAPPLFAGP
jgi:hypothetical protein